MNAPERFSLVCGCFALVCIVTPAMTMAGTVVAWGYLAAVPEDNTGFVDVAVGGGHNLGLTAGGEVRWWGLCVDCALNPDNTYVGIAAGNFSAGVTTDGFIKIAGGDLFCKGITGPQSSNDDFTAVAVGGSHCLGLRSDGSVVTWDLCTGNEIGDADGNYIDIAAGAVHSLALREDGVIDAWGSNDYGQCNVPNLTGPNDPNIRFIAIAAGAYHSLGLTANGRVVGWGNNFDGQCDAPEPIFPYTFVAIAAGSRHSLALRDDGVIVAWGNNNRGQLSVPSPNTGFVAIAAGGERSLAIRATDNVPDDDNEIPTPQNHVCGPYLWPASATTLLALPAVGALCARRRPRSRSRQTDRG